MSHRQWRRALVDMLAREDPGARITEGGKHLRITLSCGVLVVVSNTPGDHRALLNARGNVRRALRG